MSDSDDEMSLRDKLAIEILNTFLVADQGKQFSIVQEFIKNFDSEDKDESKWVSQKAERLVRSAYKFADIVRKVRMSAFE